MITVRKFLLTLLISLAIGLVHGQKNVLLEKDWRSKIADLRLEFGANKTIPEDVELAALVSLSYFPELSNTRIEFVYEKQCEFLITKPRNKMFTSRTKRGYQILMTTNKDPDKGMVIERVAFNALVGVLGHELAHVLDYSDKSVFATAMTGMKYSTSKKYRRKLERATDMATVDHGLGYQLFRIRIYFPEQETKAHDSYLDREEILDLIKEGESDSSAL